LKDFWKKLPFSNLLIFFVFLVKELGFAVMLEKHAYFFVIVNELSILSLSYFLVPFLLYCYETWLVVGVGL